MKKIKFKTKLYNIGNDTVLRLPVTASSKLSSRGLVMVEGKINRFNFRTALEPDGAGSHWFQLDSEMLKGIGVKSGDVVNLEIWQIEKWLEPKVPLDLNSLLKKNRYALTIWNDITPLARWEWIRWINATKNPQTRVKRIGVAISKLNSGDRRPCCFNSRMCSVAKLSHKGVLL